MDCPCISFYPMWVPDRSVWVSDSQQPFVEHQRMSPDVLYMKEKQALVIPCRVTHPNITTTLVKVSAGKTPEIQRHHLLISLIFYFWFRSQLSIFARFFLSFCLSSFVSLRHVTPLSAYYHLSQFFFFPSAGLRPVVSHSPDHLPHCSYLGSHYAVECVSICLCPSADMCESVCGCVCECWCLSAE